MSNIRNWNDEEFIREVIIMFDTGDEKFHDIILLPDEFDYPSMNYFRVKLFVWKDSVALLGAQYEQNDSYGIWVLDELGGSWTKQITFDLPVKPLIFWKSDEVLLNDLRNTDYSGLIFSYNLGTKKLKNLPIQSERTDSIAIVYVHSIVPVLTCNKPKSSDSSTPNDELSVSKYPSPTFKHYAVNKKPYSYSVWAFPPDDVCFRIKKVMEGLRNEFGGPEIDPHVAVVGSIHMVHEDVVNKFRLLQSVIVASYKAKVNQVVTRNSYFQCVSLLIHGDDGEVEWTTDFYGGRFGFQNKVRPHLSLFYGYLIQEEKKRAKKIVSTLDGGIKSLSFPITQTGIV